MPRAIDDFSAQLALFSTEAGLGDAAHTDLVNALANYNYAITEYNTTHPSDPQIPTISDIDEVDGQVAAMIVAAQTEANTLQLTCINLADVYAVLDSLISNLEG